MNSWVVTGKGGWQTCAQVMLGSAATSISLLAEQKPLARRFSERARADRVKRAISALEDTLRRRLELVVRERLAVNRRISYPRFLLTWTTDGTVAELAAALTAGAHLAQGDFLSPQYQIIAEFWPHSRQIERELAATELKQVTAAFDVARAALDAETLR
jgi:hypothetical protein